MSDSPKIPWWWGRKKPPRPGRVLRSAKKRAAKRPKGGKKGKWF